MADMASLLARAERRRRATTLLLLAGLVVSTLPVTNARALFTPYGEIAGPELPFAYAAVIRTGDGSRGDARPERRGGLPSTGVSPEVRPTAFAARFPSETPEPQTGSQLSDLGGTPVTPGGVGGSSFSGPGFSGLSPSDGGGVGPGPGTDVPNATSAVPEPETWAMMILGFAFVGAMLRRARRKERQSGEALA
jgi:hypothetical protein